MMLVRIEDEFEVKLLELKDGEMETVSQESYEIQQIEK